VSPCYAQKKLYDYADSDAVAMSGEVKKIEEREMQIQVHAHPTPTWPPEKSK